MNKIYKIGEIVSKNDIDSLPEINNIITELWYTRAIRSKKPNPLDEVKSLLYYLDIIYKDVFLDVEKENQSKSIQTEPILTLGSWVGGDRDGNPFVTKKITDKSLRIYSKQIINIYMDKIKDFSEEFSFSTSYLTTPKKLENKIQEYRKILKKEYN